MKKGTIAKCAVILSFFLLAIFFSSGSFFMSNAESKQYQSLADIPGITAEEIEKVKALQESILYFTYAMPPSTEAFLDGNGDVSGFTAYFCEWLESIFGIPFRPQMNTLPEIFAAMEDGTLDFTGELTATPARLEIYYMTDAIAERVVSTFRLRGSRSFEEIMKERTVKLGFITSANTINTVVNEFAEGTYETVTVDAFHDVYEQLVSGKMDAFFYSSPAEFNFDGYDDVIVENFFPLILRPVSLSTQNPDYKVIIDIVQKILNDSGNNLLSQFYAKGYHDYLRHKLNALLTAEELAFIHSGRIINYVSQYDNYPICFYNKYEGEWQGIAIDILAEITALTGLRFENVSKQNTTWADALKMLEDGTADMVTELLYTEELSKRFLWPDTPALKDKFAFISKADTPFMNANDVLHLNVGVIKETAHVDIFRKWYPDMEAHEYNDYQEIIDAMDKGEIDLMLTNQKQMLLLTNFHEMPGYKINILVDYGYESKFGFNRNEAVLADIIDKCLKIIDAEISERWMRKGFDYRLKMIQNQTRWLVVVVILLAVVVIMAALILINRRGHEKRLKNLVAERTRELTKESGQMQTIFDTIPDILFCMDTELRYIKANKSMGTHFGFREADAIGKTDHDILKIPSEAIHSLDEMNWRVIKEEKAFIFEENVPNIDGSDYVFETRKVPLVYDGQVRGLMGIARDITKRKAMEEEALQASRLKSSFLANMSHELRTPLNVIIGLTGLSIEEEGISENLQTNLRNIGNAGRTLLSIVNDILDISKIESGKLDLVPINYDLPSLIHDIAIMTKTYIGEKPILFRLSIGEDLPVKLLGDEVRVKEILTNLLSNAVKYTRSGEITLSIECEMEDGFVWLKAVITDTGIGIRSEDIAGLFTDYYQADSRTNRNIGGTGLGLPITKNLIEMMEGEIAVESVYEEGSVFSFTIKQGFVNEKKIGPDVVRNLSDFQYQDDNVIEARLIRTDLSHAKVLVVDDMVNNLDVASGLMKKYKMQVDCLTSGQAAIERIQSEEPIYDAVFMDYMMPAMDGIEAATRIRALGTAYAGEVPIIALTANAVAGAREMFLEQGFQDFLSKPIHIKDLDAILKRWVRDHKKEAETAEEKGNGSVSEEKKMKKDLIDVALLDYDKAMLLYDDDDEMYELVVASFVEHTPPVLEKMEEIYEKICNSNQAEAELLNELGILAHGIKGSCSNIAAESVRVIAAEMEKEAKGGNQDECLTLYPSFMKAVRELLMELE